ncbi:MAG: AAA family ATPase [Steroidobacteraceae bacterium]
MTPALPNLSRVLFGARLVGLWLCLLLTATGVLANNGSAVEAHSQAGEEIVAVRNPVEAATPTASMLPPDYHAIAVHIRELIAGTLPVTVNVQQLFDVPLADNTAVELEAARLQMLLGAADARPAGKTSSTSSKKAAQTAESLEPETWNARIELDRARLEFYSLPAPERERLLAGHVEKQNADAHSRALKESNDAAQRAQAAETERQQALAEMQMARSEAERLLAEERARLLGLSSQFAAQQAELARKSSQLSVHAERTLALHRKVRQVVAGRTDMAATTADALYNELRAWLRASREELAAAINTPLPQVTAVRSAEEDPLAKLTVQVDRSDVDKLFNDTVAAAASVAKKTAQFQQQLAYQLYEEVQSLNDDRLALLPYLSPERRKAITGFDQSGLDQAWAELRQVTLVLSYHLHTVSDWVRTGVWRSWSDRTMGVATATALLLKILLLIGLFYWSRRTGVSLLVDWRERLREEARRARTLHASRLDGAIDLLLRVLKPLSWLLLVLLIFWLLPDSIARLLEVELAVTILMWCLGGWFAVVTIDNLAMNRAVRIGLHNQYSTNTIRLRSLRLLGITIVAIGLILSMSRRIVGAGTIYSWVLSTCWWIALPIGLLIVHWWRAAIFTRIGFVRRKTRFESWVLANQTGWRGLPAAVLGGAYLFTKGSMAVIKAWLGGFEITRRLLAYLFRQQLDRMSERRESLALTPLPADLFTSLSPGTGSVEIIHCEDDPQVSEIINHIDRTGGGVYAVVGERGSGRSTVLHRVSDTRDDVVMTDCSFGGLAALTAALAQAAHLPVSSDLQSIAASLDAQERDLGIIIDNAHRLIHPVMGGLAEFDQLMDCARRNSTHCAWIISMDRVVWRFYGRARSVNLLFDEIVMLDDWPEEDIALLLQNRSRQAGIRPVFERLVPDLPTDLDDIERNDALAQAEKSYYRLIWDYASGNPGIALHAWRTSLGIAADKRVFVTPFRVPEAATFDKLPDSAVFVLRAVLQLERAHPEDVSRATMVPLTEVQNSLRFGLQCGYLHCVDGLYAVTWNWYRPITRFLQRRHLLSSE